MLNGLDRLFRLLKLQNRIVVRCCNLQMFQVDSSSYIIIRKFSEVTFNYYPMDYVKRFNIYIPLTSFKFSLTISSYKMGKKEVLTRYLT